MQTQYARVAAGFNTQVCFHNYFDRVLRKSGIIAKALLFVCDAQRDIYQIWEFNLDPDKTLKINLNEKLNDFEGFISFVAFPDMDLSQVNHLKVRKRISTGFYMIWQDHKNRSIDCMHEWEALASKPTALSVSNTFLPISLYESFGLITWNRHLVEDASIEVRVKDFFTDEFKLLGKYSLPCLGYLKIDIKPLLKDSFGESKSLVVQVLGQNCTPPLSFENLKTGDLHIHHF